jgi:beta-N-acetylhexosaminidase
VVRERDLPPFEAAIAAGVATVMPGHLRVPGLTAGLPATLSAAALSGLLRGVLGFTGVIISDGMEMHGVSGSLGIPEASVRAVAAGVDLLCLGRDLDEDDYLAVVAALTAAVTDGRLPVGRLEDAAGRLARFRAMLAGGSLPVAGPEADAQTGGIGLVAARRALRITGQPPPPGSRPLVIEIAPPGNLAVGSVPWGLAPWLPDGTVLQVPSGAAGQSMSEVTSAVRAADGRPVIAVVRNAHRDPSAQEMITTLLAQRPDAVVVEMGLPVWRPPARTYLATYGASRTSGQAAAEALGLTSPAGAAP